MERHLGARIVARSRSCRHSNPITHGLEAPPTAIRWHHEPTSTSRSCPGANVARTARSTAVVHPHLHSARPFVRTQIRILHPRVSIHAHHPGQRRVDPRTHGQRRRRPPDRIDPHQRSNSRSHTTHAAGGVVGHSIVSTVDPCLRHGMRIGGSLIIAVAPARSGPGPQPALPAGASAQFDLLPQQPNGAVDWRSGLATTQPRPSTGEAPCRPPPLLRAMQHCVGVVAARNLNPKPECPGVPLLQWTRVH